ncbi:GGDEF domain-containing protein [Streptomyces triculaminicus]|uniref:GGDEF domain-containing protein n=1 Tax=Streptomyces triculaminicus TaxID=2816232 RepID=UPI0037A05932
MSGVLSALAAAAPLAAGWSLHGFLQRRALRAARRDPLTGLPGRAAFERTTRRMLQGHGSTVLVLMDLDRFKAVNDTYGHGAGDVALATSAARLAGWADAHGGSAARLGGDEFTAVLPGQDDLAAALAGLHEALCKPVSYRSHSLMVGASIGAYAGPLLAEDPFAWAMRRADEAMYAMKRAGGGWQVVATPTPSITTTNGRRTGRPGTSAAGGAR